MHHDIIAVTYTVFEGQVWIQGWRAVWLKSDLSPKLNMNKEELSQT